MTALDTTKLPARELLERLLGCTSLDEIHAEIKAWLSANPPPRTEAEIAAWVDDVLAGWYAAYGDPRPRQARRADLLRFSESIIDPARDPLVARVSVFEWLETPNPRLGGRCPDDLLDSAEGLEELKAMLRADDGGTRNAPNSD
jgi:hypothetical protein